MTSDFNKIQPNHVGNVLRTEKKQHVQDVEVKAQENSCDVEEMAADTGVVGRSTVKADNFETDMKKLKENHASVETYNQLVNMLVNQGYSLEDAIYGVHDALKS